MKEQTLYIVGAVVVGGIAVVMIARRNTSSSVQSDSGSPTILPVAVSSGGNYQDATGMVSVITAGNIASEQTRLAAGQEVLGTMAGIYNRLQDKLQSRDTNQATIEALTVQGRNALDIARVTSESAAQIAELQAETQVMLGSQALTANLAQTQAAADVQKTGIAAQLQGMLASLASALSIQQVQTGGQVAIAGIQTGGQVSIAQINADTQARIAKYNARTQRLQGLLGGVLRWFGR